METEFEDLLDPEELEIIKSEYADDVDIDVIKKIETTESTKNLAAMSDRQLASYMKKQRMEQNKRGRTKSDNTFKEIAKQLLLMHPPREIKKKVMKIAPELREEDIDVKTVMLQAQIARAMKGDTRAFEVIRDTAGEKPEDVVNMKQNMPTIQVSESQIDLVVQQINGLIG